MVSIYNGTQGIEEKCVIRSSGLDGDYESFSLLKTRSYQMGFQPVFSFIHSLFGTARKFGIVATLNLGMIN